MLARTMRSLFLTSETAGLLTFLTLSSFQSLETCSSLTNPLLRPFNCDRGLLGREQTGGINKGLVNSKAKIINSKVNTAAIIAKGRCSNREEAAEHYCINYR
jgi:hypothetical protein